MLRFGPNMRRKFAVKTICKTKRTFRIYSNIRAVTIKQHLVESATESVAKS